MTIIGFKSSGHESFLSLENLLQKQEAADSYIIFVN